MHTSHYTRQLPGIEYQWLTKRLLLSIYGPVYSTRFKISPLGGNKGGRLLFLKSAAPLLRDMPSYQLKLILISTSHLLNGVCLLECGGLLINWNYSLLPGVYYKWNIRCMSSTAITRETSTNYGQNNRKQWRVILSWSEWRSISRERDSLDIHDSGTTTMAKGWTNWLHGRSERDRPFYTFHTLLAAAVAVVVNYPWNMCVIFWSLMLIKIYCRVAWPVAFLPVNCVVCRVDRSLLQ